jgi:hypothetical protein
MKNPAFLARNQLLTRHCTECVPRSLLIAITRIENALGREGSGEDAGGGVISFQMRRGDHL